MAGKSYRLRLGEFEVEGDKEFVLEMIKRYGPSAPTNDYSPLGKGKKAIEKQSVLPPPTTGKSISIREFIQRLELKKHTDISLAFGYYLEKHQGVQEFTPADITNCYYEAKLETSNTSQMIIQNIRRGYLMASKKTGDKSKNRYTLTQSGEKFVESKLKRGT
jgi:hypothetical protein